MAQDIINKNQDISYTNLDFSSIYTEIVDLAKQLSYRWDPSISDESDPGVVLLKLSSLIADKMNYNIDKSALESFPLSVTQESSARQLYEQLGYYMNWYESASTLVNLSWIGAIPSDEEVIVYTIPKFSIITDSESSRSYAIIGTIDSNGLVVSDIKLPRDGSIVQAVALEGTPVRFTFLGESVITPEMVDENNRLYLDTQYVAQNGIFIRNSGNNQDNFLEWKRVNNLYEQPYNELRYKLGIDSSTNTAYLEFPDNYAELIGAGIEITYMVIDPEFSDIPAQVLDRFLVTLNPIEDTNTYLSFDNVKIENVYASSGHKNKETIDEAYTNYKRTVGTFKTLITLRDYLNYILLEGEELCSNGFVTDRTNDPQLSYKIMSKLNGLDSLITEVEAVNSYQTVEISQEDYRPNMYYIYVPKVGNEEAHMELDDSLEYDSEKIYFLPKSEDKLTPFSLKFYLLQDAIAVNSKTTFEQTFNMIATEDLPSIDALLEDTSHIQHTYEDILPFGENTYKETEDTERKTTKSYYSYDKDNKVYKFISDSYYRPCDSSQTHPFIYIDVDEENFTPNLYFMRTTESFAPCGEWSNSLYVSAGEITKFKTGVTYYTRSGSGTQGDPYEFTKATVFEEGVDYYIVDLYTPGTFYKYNAEYDYYYTYEMPADPTKVNPYELKLYTLEDLTNVDNINPQSQGWYEIDVEALSPHVAYFRAKYPINMDITTFTVVGREVQADIKTNVLSALYQNLNSTQIEFGDKIELDYLTEIVLGADTRIKSVVFSNIEYRIEAMYYNPIHGFVGTILPTDISAPKYSDETSVTSYNICKDIFAKSILAGRTKLLDKDTRFEYHTNQSYLASVNDIYSIDSETTIDMKKVAPIISEGGYESRNYTLKENETLTLFQPKLTDSTSYEKGVHFEYLTYADIEEGDSYKLSANEYMILYSSITDENGSITDYKCNVYTNGAIINPSFYLPAQINQSYLSKYFTTEIQPDIVRKNALTVDSMSYEYTTASSYWTDYIQNNPSIINNVIAASDDITIRRMSEITITPTDGYRFYWVLNKEHKAESTGKKFYQLFGEYDSVNQKKQNASINTYTLKNGEALYYIDKDGRNMAILHAGDSITRNTGISTNYVDVDENELYTYIPVIVEGHTITGEYEFQFVKTEADQDEIDPYANGFYEKIHDEETDEDKFVLSEDTFVDVDKTYYALIMNSMSGFYENNSGTYAPSPTITYNVFKPLEKLPDDDLLSIDPLSEEKYFEKVTAQEVEIEDTYAAGNNVSVTFVPGTDVDNPDRWEVEGDLEESIISRPRFRHVDSNSILNPAIDLGDYVDIEVNDTYTYPTTSAITINKSNAISYSPLSQELYEVPEYVETSVSKFRPGATFYTYDNYTDEYELAFDGMHEFFTKEYVVASITEFLPDTTYYTYDEETEEYVEVPEGESFDDTETYYTEEYRKQTILDFDFGITYYVYAKSSDTYKQVIGEFNPLKAYYIYENDEYIQIHHPEFDENTTYYYLNQDSSEDEWVEVDILADPIETYYIGPAFYKFYTAQKVYKKAFLSESTFNIGKNMEGTYYKMTPSCTTAPSTFDSSKEYLIPISTGRYVLDDYYASANIEVAEDITYYEKVNDEYQEYPISAGETIPSDITLYVKSIQYIKYLPVNHLEQYYAEPDSDYSLYRVITSKSYTEITPDSEYSSRSFYYALEDEYTQVEDVSDTDIPIQNNWYERDEFDPDTQYYIFNRHTATFDPVYPPFLQDGTEYWYTDDDVNFISVYGLSSKVYSYKPQGIVKSTSDTPFVMLPEDVTGGLGCYYKVGSNDLAYISRTINDEYINIGASNNNLPKVLYDTIRNYRIIGKELKDITLNDIDNNWSDGYSLSYPSDFYTKGFVYDSGDNYEYVAVSLTTHSETIRNVLEDNMGSTHTLFPYYGTIIGKYIGGDTATISGSIIVMDKSLYDTVKARVSTVNGIAVKADGYDEISNEAMQTWYTIVETMIDSTNRPYVYIYLIPQYYKFRYLYNTDVENYYVLKSYVDKEFGTVDPWECDSLTSNLISTNPAQALTNMWKPLQENCSVTLRQNDLYTLTEGDTITLTSKVTSNVITWPTFTNTETILNYTNYDTSYTTSNNEIVYLANVSIDGSEWRAYSNLLINTSTGKGQQLEQNHKVTFFDEDGDELLSIPDDLENYDPKAITMFQLESPINNASGEYIQAFTRDDLGNEVLNNAYIYRQLLSVHDEQGRYDITYSSDNNTHITLYNTAEQSNTVDIGFVFPQGKYLIPMQGVKDSETEILITRDSAITSGYSATTDTLLDADKMYYTFSSDVHTHISEFETGVNYYEIGLSQFDTPAFGLTKDTVPMYNKSYYTLDVTQFKFWRGTSGTSWETLDSDVYGVDITTTYEDFDFAAGSKIIVEMLVAPDDLTNEYRLRVDNNDNYYYIYGVSEGGWSIGDIVMFEYDPHFGNFSFSVQPDFSDLAEQDDHITLESGIESATDFGTGVSKFNEDKTYYILLDNSNGDINELSISSPGSTSETTLVFGDLFKYENMYDNFIHEQLLEKIRGFDTDHIFNYTYQPADNELIDNPVQPKSFWDKNHVYNAYTIAQLDTSSTDNVNYRFITSK